MSSLNWIQTICHSNIVPEKFFDFFLGGGGESQSTMTKHARVNGNKEGLIFHMNHLLLLQMVHMKYQFLTWFLKMEQILRYL